MAMIKTTRRSWFGFRRTTVAGPSSEGTKAAFMLAEYKSKARKGAKAGLKRAVAMHKANTLSTDCPQ